MNSNDYTEQASAIAQALGATLQSPYEHKTHFLMTMPDGVVFYISFGGWNLKGRISVGHAFPQHVCDEEGRMRTTVASSFQSYKDTTDASITVSETKTPAQVAKDIERRFLPVYRPLWGQALAFIQQQADYYSSKKRTMEAIEKARKGTSGVYVRNYWEKGADLEVSCDVPLALQIIELVKTYHANKPDPS